MVDRKDGKKVGLGEGEEDKKPKFMTAELVIDSTRPEKVKIGTLPRQLPRGTSLPVKATGDDLESGIKEVYFFVGKPTAEDKPPKEAELVKAQRPTDKEPAWTANLPLPADKKGTLEITVQFINEANLSAFDTVKLELIDPPAPVGNLRVKVLYDERLQPEAEVVVTDGKTTLSNPERIKEGPEAGTVLFKNVPPGPYRVIAVKKENRKINGEASVTVEANKTTTAEVKISFK
jgi:hypothetical protein